MRKTVSGFAAAALWSEALYTLFICAGITMEWVVGRSEFEGLHLREFALCIGWTAVCVRVGRSAVRLPRNPSVASRWGLLTMAAVHLLLAVPLFSYRNPLIAYGLIAVGALLVVVGVQRAPRT
ncbi:hypothetical protein [Kitasatospora sp. NPDC094015]|uniref:hypothetical protein n=1 Tax=Kitasatospora sp. NPDC094015 TaxID=3155205 RepID=UPI003326B8A2